MILLETRDLEVTVAGNRVCTGLSLQARGGETWGLLGGNGVGKTTLLHTLAGLRAAQQGEIVVAGRPLQGWHGMALARKRGLLFQEHPDLFPATVLETALSGRHPHLARWQWEGHRDRQIALQALADVALQDCAGRYTDTLSGGERQRLAIATLLTQEPQVALLDEPTNHLDLHHQIGMLSLLGRRLGACDGLLFMSLHDINLAARFCSHLLMLFGDGECLYGPAPQLLERDTLERLYRHPVAIVDDGRQRAYIPAP